MANRPVALVKPKGIWTDRGSGLVSMAQPRLRYPLSTTKMIAVLFKGGRNMTRSPNLSAKTYRPNLTNRNRFRSQDIHAAVEKGFMVSGLIRLVAATTMALARQVFEPASEAMCFQL